MFNTTRNENEKWFCRSCLQSSSSESVLKRHKDDFLAINGAQRVRLEKGVIKFKNYCNQIPSAFRIYAGFESNLDDVNIWEGNYSKKYHKHVDFGFSYKVVCTDARFSKRMKFCRGKNAAYEFVKSILEKFQWCKKVMKKYFNNNLIMTEKEEYDFQISNVCWICKRLIDDDNVKVRDQCHVTGKFRGAAHWDCNINLTINKKVKVKFRNLRGSDSHLIFSELSNFDVKIEVIPNRLEKYIAFILNRDLVLI